MFSVASAPVIWQRTIEQILQNIPGTQVILDDIIITENWPRPLRELVCTKISKLLRNYNVRAEITKCEFFKESITYCEHRIDKQRLYKIPDKIDAVVNAPRPTNVTQLRAYLGLLNIIDFCPICRQYCGH